MGNWGMKSGIDLATITDDCLERLASGESVEQCLARHPEAAAELAPILAAAVQLSALSQLRLTAGQRLRAKVTLREALAAQCAERDRARRGPGLVGWARLRVAPVAALVAVLLFASVAVSAVAASQPGDFAYPVRVAVERVPALVQPDTARRVAAELAAADRRLSDITQDDGAHAVAVNALLSSDEAALDRAGALSEAERDEIEARVVGHAAALERLANEAADPQTAGRLRDAAGQALALTGRAKSVVILPTPTATHATGATPAPAGASLTPSAAQTPVATQAPPRPASPTSTGVARAPVATVTLRPRPRMTATVVAPTDAPTGAPPAESTSRPRPTWTDMPEYTPRPRPTWTALPPEHTPRPRVTWTSTPPEHTPRPRPTLSSTPTGEAPGNPPPVVPTVDVPTVIVPTVVVPTIVVPTPLPSPTAPGHASGSTPTATLTATPWWQPTPTETRSVPTRERATLTPTALSTTAPTATVGWATFTPLPTATPPAAAATATPEPTRTPRRQRTETPAVSPTSGATDAPSATPTDGTDPAAPSQP